MCSCSSLLLVFLALMVISSLGLGLAQITVGTRNLHDCPLESFLPVAVVVNGALAALLAVWGVWDAVRANSKWTGVPGEAERLMGPSVPNDACVQCMEAVRWLLNTAAVAWASLTLFVALRIRDNYVRMAANSPAYCDPDLVRNSVILAAVSAGNAGLVVLIGFVCNLIK